VRSWSCIGGLFFFIEKLKKTLPEVNLSLASDLSDLTSNDI